VPPRFPLFIDLTGSTCLVVGAGPVALRRVRSLQQCGAIVRVVAPHFHEGFADLPPIQLLKRVRPFVPEDLEGARLCVAATSDAQLNAHIATLCSQKHIPVNVASNALQGSFHFPALVCRDDISIGLHAGGRPTLAKRLRTWLDHILPRNPEEIP